MKKILSPTELRHFGFALAGAIALVFGLVLPWLFDNSYPRWPWYTAGAILLPAVFMPRALAPVYAAWRPVALVLGYINTRIILGALFYVIIWPFGLALRVAGKLQYRRELDSQAESYRVANAHPSQPDHYEKPF
jgi:hypothetical protein